MMSRSRVISVAVSAVSLCSGPRTERRRRRASSRAIMALSYLPLDASFIPWSCRSLAESILAFRSTLVLDRILGTKMNSRREQQVMKMIHEKT